jgi:serine/threonine protein kinase
VQENLLSVYMVFPRMDYNLMEVLASDRARLQPSLIKILMRQLLEGLEYLHQVWSLC